MGARPRTIVITGAGAIAALLGCGQAYAIDAAVIDAAKREGEVVWYSTQIGRASCRERVSYHV